MFNSDVFYLEIVLSVDIGPGQVVLDLEGGVPDLDGQPVLQVEQAGLANVLQLGAGLTHLRLLEPHLGAGAPAEHGVRPRADLALLAVLLLRHPDVGVVSETRLAQDGEVCVLPVLSIVSIRALRCGHCSGAVDILKKLKL